MFLILFVGGKHEVHVLGFSREFKCLSVCFVRILLCFRCIHQDPKLQDPFEDVERAEQNKAESQQLECFNEKQEQQANKKKVQTSLFFVFPKKN